MGAHNSRQHRLLYGDSRRRSIRWLVVAAGFAVIPLAIVYLPALLEVAVTELGANVEWTIDGGFVIYTVIGLGVLGVVGSVIQAYLNDGLFVSIVLALAPWAGLMSFIEGSRLWLLFTDPVAETMMGSGVYLYMIPGAFALLVGVVGFALGAGARRLVKRV